MGVNWQSAINAENQWIGMFDPLGGLSQSEYDWMKASGVPMGNIDAAKRWRETPGGPIVDNSQLGQGAMVANQARYDQLLGLNRMRESLAADQLNRQGDFLAGQYRLGMRDYDTARSEMEGVGATARSDLLNRETRQKADVNQSLRARGLGNTSVQQNASRGVTEDTNRGLNDLSERIAGMRSGLAERRAGARQSLGRDLSEFSLRRTGIETGLLGDRQAIIGNRTDSYNPGESQVAIDMTNKGMKSDKWWDHMPFGAMAGAATGGLMSYFMGGGGGGPQGGGGGGYQSLFGGAYNGPGSGNPYQYGYGWNTSGNPYAGR